jgi:hypothetical protein
MNVYVKSVAESGVNAMDLLGAELRKTQLATTLQQETPMHLLGFGNSLPSWLVGAEARA